MDDETEAGAPLFGLIVLFVGAAFITIGVVFLVYGLYALVRTGLWPHYPFSRMLGEVGIPLPRGGAGPVAWVLAQSACAVLLAIGTMIAAVGVWLIVRANRRHRLAAHADEAPA
jgi:hypothetical protein